jgi:hypothetical protein
LLPGEVAAGSEEQARGIEQITRTVNEMERVTQQAVAGSGAIRGGRRYRVTVRQGIPSIQT